MIFLFFLFVSIGCALIINKRFQFKLYSIYFILVSAAVVLLYISGLYDYLNQCALILTVVGVFCAIYAYLIVCRNSNTTLTSNHLAVAAPFLFYLFAIPKEYFFTSQDTFEWWGASVRWMVDNDSLVDIRFPEGKRNYPPGQQLFQYLVIKLSGWSEINALRAQNIFTLSAVLYTVSELSKNQRFVGLIFILTSATLYFFQFGYTTIMNDALLGACFAAAITSSIVFRANTGSYIKIFLTYAALILLKDLGIILVMVATPICILKYYFLQNDMVSYRRLIRTGLFAVVVTGFVFLVRFSWIQYVASIESTQVLRHLSLVDLFSDYPIKNLAEIWDEFANRIWSRPFFDMKILKVNLVLTTAIFSIVSFFMIGVSGRENRTRNLLVGFVFIAGLLAFILAHLYLYLIWFGDYEGPRLASFERYMSIYYLAWLILLVPYVSSWAIGKFSVGSPKLFRAGSIVLVTMSILGSGVLHAKHVHIDPSLVQKRSLLERAANISKTYMRANEKVYFIYQNSVGYEESMFGYLMFPMRAGNWCWSLGKRYYPEDVWTCEENLDSLVLDFDYLFIFKADNQFWKNNGRLFNREEIGQTSGLYRINRSGESIKFARISE